MLWVSAMLRVSAANFIAIIGAALGWAALALQLGLLIVVIEQQGGTVAGAVWRFVGFFILADPCGAERTASGRG
jgi:hypothetical protein